MGLHEVGAIAVDAQAVTMYEHGWQSWSPAALYPAGEPPARPRTENSRIMNWRQDTHPPPDAFWGEGLLAVDPGDGSAVTVFAAAPGADPVPSVRADVRGRQVVVSADGPVLPSADTRAASLWDALGRWAEAYAAAAGVALRPATPTAWCSWYQYFTNVSADDIRENLAAMDRLGLGFDVLQIDDGYQAEIGDWLSGSGRFGSLDAVVADIRSSGRRAGIWIAPFLVSPRSDLYRRHRDWLVGQATAGWNWGADQAVLDVTHPGAEDHLRTVFATLRDLGIDYFKIDFLYAGAVPGQRADANLSPLMAYRRGLELIRQVIGPDSYLLGCGAPLLPTVGLVDAMRVSPDTGPRYEPADGDLSLPSQRSATLTGRARSWQNGRFWVNDPDCLIVRPEVERREDWAAHIGSYGGLLSCSDRLGSLDDWGIEVTARLLAGAARHPSTGPASQHRQPGPGQP